MLTKIRMFMFCLQTDTALRGYTTLLGHSSSSGSFVNGWILLIIRKPLKHALE